MELIMEKYLNTGHYLNYWKDDGKFDLFIIINEGNYEAVDPISVEKLNTAISICDNYIADRTMNNEECEELDQLLSEVFEFGVQVFKRSR